jgi:hypothetical protein
MNVLAVKESLYPTLPPWKAETGAVSRLLAVKLPVSNVLHIETLDKPPLLSAVRRTFYAVTRLENSDQHVGLAGMRRSCARYGRAR